MTTGTEAAGPAERVTIMPAPVRLDYQIGAGAAPSRFLLGLAEGKIRGQRCPVCRRVYCPPRGACPTDGVPTEEEVELAHTGIVTTYCVVNIRFSERAPDVPYVCAQVLLDGADTSLFGLIAGVEAREVHMGMRVRAVWVPREEWRPTLENIKWFEPAGEPDADFEAYREYL
jgi:uncharacterized OB-fold protein